MSKFARLIALATLGLVAGCGGKPDTSNPGTPPPHGGSLSILPDNLGFVEIVKGDGKGPELAFYFLKPDISPITPAPTSGKLVVGSKTEVALTPQDGGLVTPAGKPLFPNGDPSGELRVGMDGKTITVPLGVR